MRFDARSDDRTARRFGDAAEPDPMTRIVHISDLHFGREQPQLVDALAECIDAMAPDLVAASGDLTQRARWHELRAAAAFLRRLPQPVLVVPGNHDIPGITPERLLNPWRRWLHQFPGTLEPLIEDGRFIALGANSVRSWGPYLDWSRGRLGRQQIDRLAARIRQTPTDRLRILVAHHPLLLTAAGARRGLVGRHQIALRSFARAGLDLALGGHVHRGYAGIAEGIVVAHAGTGVSNRLVGEPNGFNLISGDRRRLTVDHWQWTGDAFQPQTSQAFARDENGWRHAPGC
jgi:3',5'-cyclic AMP phosphodiesterase CpdA